jgi:two-component system alkaline phosphatase synthesis response regulator PhoP
MPKVLVAEDDPSIASLLDILLGMEGYQVAILGGRERVGVEAVRREKPDIILLDILLGEVNGIELARQIRQSPELARTRLIMTSGMDRREECLAAGADDFLLKPYMPEQLLDKLKAADR